MYVLSVLGPELRTGPLRSRWGWDPAGGLGVGKACPSCCLQLPVVGTPGLWLRHSTAFCCAFSVFSSSRFLRSKRLVRLGPTRLHWDLYLVTSAGSSIEVLGVCVQSHGAELGLGRAVCSPWSLTAWHLLPMIFWEALLFSSQGHSHPEAKELPVRPLHSVTETLCDPRLAAAESRSALPLLMWGWAGGRRLLFSVSAAAPV